jgi:hypothetical protein
MATWGVQMETGVPRWMGVVNFSCSSAWGFMCIRMQHCCAHHPLSLQSIIELSSSYIQVQTRRCHVQQHARY